MVFEYPVITLLLQYIKYEEKARNFKYLEFNIHRIKILMKFENYNISFLENERKRNNLKVLW